MNRQERRAANRKGKATAASSAAAPFMAGLEHHQAGRLDEAGRLYQQALRADPRHVDSLNFSGVLALQRGASAESLAYLEQALKLAPNVPALHYNYAGTLRALGRLDEAVRHYRRAIQLQPNHQGAFNNLGRILHEQGRMAEAVTAYQAALRLGADPRILCNLGKAWLEQGAFADAAACYERARTLAPALAEALDGLARGLLGCGRAGDALAAVQAGMLLGETPELRRLFVAGAKAISTVADPAGFATLVERALREGWGRPGDLARLTAAIVAGREPMAGCVARRFVPGPGILAELASDSLLLVLLQTAPICHRELERAFTAIRPMLLEAQVDPAVLRFACALAEQCFINEYVFDVGTEELARAETLGDALSSAIVDGRDVPALWPVAVAAYLPLVEMPGAAALLDRTWPAPVAALLNRQVREPLQERALRDSIPCLTPISHAVSRAVQAQYEDNPYPRWVAVEAPSVSITLQEHLARSYPSMGIQVPGRDGQNDILVAGCGTGQQPIEIARSFRGARVLAIDLSRASLAYARRQTEALGVSGIEYAQADLLELGTIERRFDVIEASGVLHHLADPLLGWRVLLRLLRPGGLMFLGLYSAAARQDVVAARRFIAAEGFRPVPEDIRRCRQMMLDAAEKTPLRRLSGSTDFASMSACRDLLFHVQEHRFTLGEIGAFLSETGLELLGFDLPGGSEQRYRDRFPQDPAMTSLQNWTELEQEHPHLFADMYQFWVRQG